MQNKFVHNAINSIIMILKHSKMTCLANAAAICSDKELSYMIQGLLSSLYLLQFILQTREARISPKTVRADRRPYARMKKDASEKQVVPFTLSKSI